MVALKRICCGEVTSATTTQPAATEQNKGKKNYDSDFSRSKFWQLVDFLERTVPRIYGSDGSIQNKRHLYQFEAKNVI